eukprot:6194017-Pleurochrysis_carterae.AAC.1
MSTYAMTSTIRGRTIHLFNEAKKREKEHDAPTIRVDLSRLLHTLLGPSHTQKELGEKQTEEQAAQERDVHRFIRKVNSGILSNLLATYDYLDNELLFPYLLFPMFKVFYIGENFRFDYRLRINNKQGSKDDVFNYAMREAIRLRSPSAVRRVLVEEDFKSRILSEDVVSSLMFVPWRFHRLPSTRIEGTERIKFDFSAFLVWREALLASY